MSDKSWKREERIVAKSFNTTRALMKGTAEKSDIAHDIFCLDTKLRQNWQVDKWFSELKDYARKQDKTPILVVRKPRAKQRLAVIELDYLIAVLKGAGLIQ